MKKITFCGIVVTLSLFACAGDPLPNCDSQEVLDVLKGISKDNGVTLSRVEGVTTLSREKRKCRCAGLATFFDSNETAQLPIEYAVELADNNNEFVVILSLR